jgi:hypothetical protein
MMFAVMSRELDLDELAEREEGFRRSLTCENPR